MVLNYSIMKQLAKKRLKKNRYNSYGETYNKCYGTNGKR